MGCDLSQILDQLKELRQSPRSKSIFGAESHDFRLNPVLPEPVAAEFELKHRVTLPTVYREFLIQVGNGGAGPGHGVFKLGETDDGWGCKQWREDDGFVGVLSEPFQHIAPWNGLTGEPEFEPGKDLNWEKEYERRLEAFEARYFDPRNMNGAIPICHLGCARRVWLVVTGKERGNVWADDRAEHRGLYPLEGSGMNRMSFLNWYDAWLGGLLAKGVK